MPNAEQNFSQAASILFATLPLTDLKALLTTDKASREAASKVIFARNDDEALLLQEDLLTQWLVESSTLPLNLTSLNSALRRTASSLHYKILCLLLIRQLKEEKPEIDKEDLLDYVKHGLVSQEKSQFIAAIQALPTALLICKPSQEANEQAPHGDWNDNLTSWWKYIAKQSISLLEEKANQFKSTPHVFSIELTKALLFLFANTKEKNSWLMAYVLSLQHSLFLRADTQDILIYFLKKHGADFFSALNLNDILTSKTEEVNPEVIYFNLLKMMPFLLDSQEVNKSMLDKLISMAISYSFIPNRLRSISLETLNAIAPKLSPKHLNDLFARLDSVTSNLQVFLVTYLPNLFRASKLTPAQINRLAALVTGKEFNFRQTLFETRRHFLKNFFKFLPSFYASVSAEQKNKLIAKVKALCLNPKFWSSMPEDARNSLQLLSSADFAEVFTVICHHVDEIEKITFILPELLTTPQLTREQFATLIEELDNNFWDDNFWKEEARDDLGQDYYELSSLHNAVTNSFISIFQSSYLSETTYSKWLNRLADVIKKGFSLNALPAALISPHLTQSQFSTIINQFCEVNIAAMHKHHEHPFCLQETLTIFFASPKLTDQLFTLLLDTILEWKPEQEILLGMLPTILLTSKTMSTSTKKQTHNLLHKVLSEFKNAYVSDACLKLFLYDPLIMTALVNNPQDLELLELAVEALNSNPDSSPVLESFLCHLVISKKISAEDLHSLSAKYSLSKLVSTFTSLYTQLMPSKNTTQSDSTKRHSMFNTSPDYSKQKDNEEDQKDKEDQEEYGPPTKKARGPGLD